MKSLQLIELKEETSVFQEKNSFTPKVISGKLRRLNTSVFYVFKRYANSSIA